MKSNEEYKIVSTREVMEFISIVKDMPSDVALEALAEYPEFLKMINETVKEENQVKQKVIEARQQNAEQCFLFYQEILNDISLLLQNQQLSFTERMQLIDKQIEVARIVQETNNRLLDI